MYIKKAELNDLDSIMDIYHVAQNHMIENGNPTQWGHSYPGRELIESDILNGNCHVISDESIHGVFALFKTPEPTYEYIENGNWLNDEEYVTIHRIASDGTKHNVFKCAVDYCKGISDNIRIDTHKDNLIMQKVIERNQFIRCGTIYVRNGSPRMAYQWSKSLMK